MHVIAHTRLVAFYQLYPEATLAVENWYDKATKAEWTCFADMKKTFNSVDGVGNQRYVFNIKGNMFRLIVLVKFQIQIMYIRFIGTHEEYDKIKDIKNI